MLKKRIITAAILIPLVLVILFYVPDVPFLILTGALTLWGAFEWSQFVSIKTTLRRCFYVMLVFLVMGSVLFYLSLLTVLTLAFFFWLVAVFLVIAYPTGSKVWASGVVLRGLMGFLTLVPCWLAVNYIRSQADGAYGLLFLFILIWGADSVAYFAGKTWGKTKLAPEVSPGKSVQGATAAIIFATLMPMAVLCLLGTPVNIWFWAALLSVITVIFSIFGDLFESMMKRQVGIKDSGRLLPGHGGLLDRIDSLTAAAPIFTLGGILLGGYLH